VRSRRVFTINAQEIKVQLEVINVLERAVNIEVRRIIIMNSLVNNVAHNILNHRSMSGHKIILQSTYFLESNTLFKDMNGRKRNVNGRSWL
jgi:hypothetical protein